MRSPYCSYVWFVLEYNGKRCSPCYADSETQVRRLMQSFSRVRSMSVRLATAEEIEDLWVGEELLDTADKYVGWPKERRDRLVAEAANYEDMV